MDRASIKSSRTHTRGFTLIEVVIVIMIIALFAGLIIPRLSGVSQRAEKLTVDRVEDLLAAFSYRDSLASGSTAIEYSSIDHSLVLLTLWVDPDAPDDPATWSRDILVPVVRLPESLGMRVYEEGELLPDGDWSIITRIDGTRPKIEIQLFGTATDATVMLDPWAQGPYVVDELAEQKTVLSDAIDLDAVGQDKEPW